MIQLTIKKTASVRFLLREPPSAEDRETFEDKSAQLFEEIQSTALANHPKRLALLPNVEIFHKAEIP
ncbi:MAG: hypothetical protein M2R45_04963 [Verrucomicrobia subdivision 3 bacterium]|nr:hypothetical protein [Limisphaerales bacterium]MCS1414090.1 hypothetical protein [Limisphaerales bacterium]